MALLISVGVLLALGLWGYGCHLLTAARSRSASKEEPKHQSEVTIGSHERMSRGNVEQV